MEKALAKAAHGESSEKIWADAAKLAAAYQWRKPKSKSGVSAKSASSMA